MKILKIENGEGLFINPAKSSGNNEEYLKIDQITKEDILAMLEFLIDNERDMDECTQNNNIMNPAQKIIYENIYSKLNAINFIEIKKNVDDAFAAAENKYCS
ncbi:MAG: hypothetical protein J5691_05700 [Bacilli bacterium]|nr:hypothetical protein [Bacilli bacterium]